VITLITATPGSGKTLTAIQIIIDALSQGRPVYSNINGLVTEKFPNHHNLHPAPDDWRDTPEGSLVVYDECQQPHLYPSTAQRGRVEDERLTAMETHRHTGHDLIFITQAPTFVHHHVRKLVGQHIHLYRGRGIGGAMRYEWSHTCDNPNDRREQERADSRFWKFPREHFDFYQSATIHTHKFSIPRNLAIFLVFLLLAISYLGYRIYDNRGLASFHDDLVENSVAESSVIQSSSLNPIPVSTPEYKELSTPISGCASSEHHCRCYSSSGQPLDMPTAQCLSIIAGPIPRSVVVGGGSGAGASKGSSRSVGSALFGG